MSTIQDNISDFLRYLRYEKRYAAHTIINYENDLLSLKDFLENQTTLQTIAELKAFHLRTWLAILKNDQHIGDNSLIRKRSSMSSFCRYLMKKELLKTNPAKELRQLKTPQRLPQFVTESDMEVWLNEDDFAEGFEGITQRLIVELLYQCGLRRQELLSLKDYDVEYSLKQLRVIGKGNKERLIPLSTELLTLIKNYQQDRDSAFGTSAHGYLLVLTNGKPLYGGYVYRFINKALQGKTTVSKKSPHVLRHTFATQLLNNGANIQAIKELLGHSSLAATQVYTHTSIDKLRDIHKKNHPRG